jgi:hypothetical protein
VPTVKITKSAIDALSVPAKDTVYWDAGLPGFGVKVTPKGKKVFIVPSYTAPVELALDCANTPSGLTAG